MTESEIKRILNPKKILMTTDFSENSGAAFPYGVTLARDNEAEIVLVHVIAEDHFARNVFDNSPMMNEFVDRIEGGVTQRLKEVALRGVKEGSIRRRVVRSRTPAAGIIECAKSENADLIVMATRGLGVFRQLVMGSSARRVIGTAPCPVLCVKPGETGMLDEVPGSIEIERVLIPTDTSENSLLALRVGMALAGKHKAQVKVLYVSETQVPPMYRASGIGSMFALDSDLPKRIREHLENILKALDTYGVQFDIEIEEGQASKEIARFATEFDADLVVISRKGVGNTPHLLGGVTERLLHHAKHPMLIV
jgi:nucleotide-binding universal stress UspA family protein